VIMRAMVLSRMHAHVLSYGAFACAPI
jgi:hypothetical protein